MGMPWFRFYGEVLNDPKVQRLPDNIFKIWVNLLCIASNNEGVFPDMETLSYQLRCNKNTVSEAFHILIESGLIAVSKNQYGETFHPHNWKERQYKSDTSTDRVRKFREAKRNVSRNVSETAPDTDTEQKETDKENKIDKSILSKKNTSFKKPDDVSDSVWNDFVQHRRAKKAPVTDTVIKSIRGETVKLGWTLDKALAEICARGWQGFKADWVIKDGGKVIKQGYTETLMQAAQRAHENITREPIGGNSDEIYG